MAIEAKNERTTNRLAQSSRLKNLLVFNIR